MSATTPTPASGQIDWLTATEARRVSKAMYDGITPLDEFATHARRLLDEEDLRDIANPPNFEELGILAAVAGYVEEQIACSTSYLEDLHVLLKAGKRALALEPTEDA